MAVTIDGLKGFAATDPNVADTTLQLCMDAAICWLNAAGVKPRDSDASYDLAVYRLATHYYDTRGNQEAGKDDVPPTVMSLMHQLRSEPEAVSE